MVLRRFIAYGSSLVLATLVFSNPPENEDGVSSEQRWDKDVPDAITVKKSGGSNAIAEAVILTREQERAIVTRHNERRSIASPPAKNMRKMSWDEELATVAREYTRKCIYEHNPDRSHSRFRSVGENLYISMGIPMGKDLVANAVSAWDNEKTDYDYETRHCVPGKMCGHYTQVVWDDTFKVGCGVTICSKIMVRGKQWTHATLFACNYGPAGNYPRHPFQTGLPCTGCHKRDRCSEKLCTNSKRDRPYTGNRVATWMPWSSWSPCSATCIGGFAQRTRLCSTFVASDCEGSAREFTYTCSDNFCGEPVIPGQAQKWLAWEPWSSCSRTCGIGTVIRIRKCKAKEACAGINKLTMACNKGDCPVPGWSNWGRWDTCSVTCGMGLQKKKRSCTTSTSCPGKSERIKECRVQPCKTVPIWSDWTTWTACSVSCGGGSRSRSRSCKTGTNCQGAKRDTDACNIQKCPGTFSPWSLWDACSVSCGGGTTTRTRFCLTGGNCEGAETGITTCNVDDCPEFGEWTSWSGCDVTCGSGNIIRTRVCSSSNADDCSGNSAETKSCTKPKCTISGWSQWSPFSLCSKTCGGGTKISNRVCNAGNSGPTTCEGENIKTKRCKPQKCPEFNQWTEWSPCGATCGVGRKSRTRSCNSPSGRGCTGNRRETASCKVTDCTKSVWKKWEAWSLCSENCGGGSQSRSRECDVGNIGPTCIGANIEIRTCNENSCETPDEEEPPKERPDEKDPPNKGPNERNNKSESGSSNENEDPGGSSNRLTNSTLLLIFSLLLSILTLAGTV